MAKPTYSIGGLDFPTLQRVEAFLGGAPVTAAPPPPVAAAPPPVAAAAPPPPAAAPPPVAAAPPPVAVQAAAPPAPVAVVAVPGALTMEQLVAKMAEKVGVPGNAAKVSALMAQYNAKEPGKPGPITNVDPVQYANLAAALDAL